MKILIKSGAFGDEINDDPESVYVGDDGGEGNQKSIAGSGFCWKIGDCPAG